MTGLLGLLLGARLPAVLLLASLVVTGVLGWRLHATRSEMEAVRAALVRIEVERDRAVRALADAEAAKARARQAARETEQRLTAARRRVADMQARVARSETTDSCEAALAEIRRSLGR